MPLLCAKGQHICCSNAATRQFTCAGTWSAKFDLSNWNDKFWYDFALFKVQVFSLPEYNAYLPLCVKGFVVCYTERNFLVFWATDAAQGKMCSSHLHREKNNSIKQRQNQRQRQRHRWAHLLICETIIMKTRICVARSYNAKGVTNRHTDTSKTPNVLSDVSKDVLGVLGEPHAKKNCVYLGIAQTAIWTPPPPPVAHI